MSEEAPRKHWRWIAITAIGCVVAMVLAFFVGMAVRSPNEEATNNSKRAPSVLAKVEKRDLTVAQAEAGGVAKVGESWDVAVPAAEGVTPVVTAVNAAAGEEVTSGSVLARVSGRPVIVLALPFELYRDIRLGDSGDDVRALQSSLHDLGYYRAVVDGVYGAHTATAVEKLYKANRVQAPKPVPASSEEGTADETKEAPAAANPSSQAEDAQAVTEAAPAPTPKLTPVIRTEIVAIRTARARVESIAAVGTKIGGETPLAKLRGGEATVIARIAVGDKAAFAQGRAVTVALATDSTVTTSGTIREVSDFKPAESEKNYSVPGYDLTISLANSGTFSDGQEVRVAGDAAAGKRNGTVVPITAIRKDDNGTYVLLGKEGARKPVNVSLVSDGFAMVGESELNVGDDVLVSTGS